MLISISRDDTTITSKVQLVEDVRGFMHVYLILDVLYSSSFMNNNEK